MMDGSSIASSSSQRRNIFPRHQRDSSSRSQRSVADSSHSGRLSSKEEISMDEALRRVGHRLSQTVGGNRDTPRPVANLLEGQASSSAFSIPGRGRHNLQHGSSSTSSEDSAMPDAPSAATDSDPSEEVFDRSSKVAKVTYTDHGSHQRSTEPGHESILRRLTERVRDTYDKAKQTPRDSHKASSKKRTPPGVTRDNHHSEGTTLSPHRQAMSQLALDDRTLSSMSVDQDSQEPVGNKGLLQAALDQQDPTKPRIRGKCLTSPSDAVSNDGIDNADGNLIVHQSDRIQVPPAKVTKTTYGGSEIRNEFVVLEPLGQGTFAQVFKCQCVATGELVAVKIVKNKPAYTRQAAVEIDVFRVLRESNLMEKNHMVRLLCHFIYKSHLCLVFELLGLNLYEVLKKRQFRGLPLAVVRNLIQQTMEGVKDLSQKSIVHCDIKPENILLINEEEVEATVNAGERVRPVVGQDIKSNRTDSSSGLAKSGTISPVTEETGRTTASDTSSRSPERVLKLIDFGSACFEGHTAHTYIQSRFYRSPEVLIGLPYDSAIDMWSLGCVAAELFLGLPILPGVHEHDQIGRIREMIGELPDWMLEEGSKTTKYFVKHFSRPSERKTQDVLQNQTSSPVDPPRAQVSWRMKTLREYIQSLSANEVRKKGGLAKLEKQPTNRYFKRKRLADIIMLHGQASPGTSKEELGLFVHFLLGILDPDPWKRWTAYQASMHPFITGSVAHRRRQGIHTTGSSPAQGDQIDNAIREYDIYWVPPWDPSICKRKLLNVQKTREKQQTQRRSAGQNRSQAGPVSLSRTAEGTQRADDLEMKDSTRFSHAAAVDEKQVIRRQTSLPTTNQQRQVIYQPGSMQNSAFPAPQQVMAGATASSGFVVEGPLYHPSYIPVGMQPSMIMTDPAAYFAANQPMQFISGPQSLSGLSYDGLGHFPATGELGYALQRPGVFPGTSSDLSGSFTMNQPMHLGISGAYSPHHFPSGPSSLTGHPSHHGGWRRHSSTHSFSGRVPQSYDHSLGMVGAMHGSGGFLTSPTSIHEDATDIQLGGQNNAAMLSSSLQTSSHGSATSLLAQQLEGRSSMQISREPSMQDMSHGQDSNFAPGLPQYVGPESAPFGHSGGLPTGQYYGFVPTGGMTMMSAPANVVSAQPTHLNYPYYGGYIAEGGPPGSLGNHQYINTAHPPPPERHRGSRQQQRGESGRHKHHQPRYERQEKSM